MEKFEITILGCGSALPTLRHLPSAQIIEWGNKMFMIDCGEGAQLQLRRQKLAFARLNHIFISHEHGDHCFGLIGMLSTFSMLGRTKDLHIYGPQGVIDFVTAQLKYYGETINYALQLHPVDTKTAEVVYEDRSLSISTIPLSHRVACCGYLVKEKPKLRHIRRDMIDFYGIPNYAINNIKQGEDWLSPKGERIANELLTTAPDASRSYAYCSDTKYVVHLHQYFPNVNLLYHEATFAESERARAKQVGHSTARQAAMVAQAAHAKQLIIGHFSARYTDERPLLDEAKAVFENTVLAKEGLKMEVKE